jgi:hypothetical protein
MTSKDTVDDLKGVFKWKCNNGYGTDVVDGTGTPCP